MKRRQMLRRVGMGAAAVAGTGLLAACAPVTQAPVGSAAPATAAPSAAASKAPLVPKPIRISNTPDNQSPTDFMTLVPQKLGLYQKYGADAKIIDGTTASVGPLFLSGGIDVLLHGSAIFSQALAGQDVRMILGLGAASPFSLVTRAEIKTVADIKGKRLANQALTGSIFEMSKFVLQKNGVNPADVQFQAIAGQPQILAALIAGRVDAAMLPWQQAYLAKQDPTLRVLDEDPTAGGFALKGYRFAGVKADWAAQNEQAIVGFVAGVIEAQRMMAKDENLYKTQAKELFPSLDPGLVTDMYRIKANVGYWAVNGGVEPTGINGNLEFYRKALQDTGAKDSPATNMLDLKYAKAALDMLGGTVPSKSDPGSWYKK